jgi:hypothetical protein
MVPVSDEHSISVPNLQRQISRGGRIIKVLKGEAFRMVNPVIVNLVQVNFLWGIMDIMLMGGVARPVSARSVDLHGDQAVGRKLWPDDVNDLARSVLASPQTADDIPWSDELGLKAGVGGNPTLGHLACGLGFEDDTTGGRKIKSIGIAIEDVLSLSNAYFTFTPVCQALPPQKNENYFFVLGFKLPDRPGCQSPHKEAHPLPTCFLSGEPEQFTGQICRKIS